MLLFVCFLFVVLFLVIFYIYDSHYGKKIDIKGKVVFITGCDTGFGNMLAKQLDKQGVRVIAGCYLDESVKTWKDLFSNNSMAVQVDISDEKSVGAAYETIRQVYPDGIFAVVNNAGINEGLAVELTPMDVYKKVMEVNYFGLIRITKAFIPLLKKTSGRFINMSSIAGVVAPPCFSPYVGSKFAIEGFSDSLRREMAVWGVDVSVIECGFMRTPMLDNMKNAFQRAYDRNPDNIKQLYGQEWCEHFNTEMTGMLERAGEPQSVVDVYIEALSCYRPKLRYSVAGLFGRVLTKLPAALVDLPMHKVFGIPNGSKK